MVVRRLRPILVEAVVRGAAAGADLGAYKVVVVPTLYLRFAGEDTAPGVSLGTEDRAIETGRLAPRDLISS